MAQSHAPKPAWARVCVHCVYVCVCARVGVRVYVHAHVRMSSEEVMPCLAAHLRPPVRACRGHASHQSLLARLPFRPVHACVRVCLSAGYATARAARPCGCVQGRHHCCPGGHPSPVTAASGANPRPGRSEQRHATSQWGGSWGENDMCVFMSACLRTRVYVHACFFCAYAAVHAPPCVLPCVLQTCARAPLHAPMCPCAPMGLPRVYVRVCEPLFYVARPRACMPAGMFPFSHVPLKDPPQKRTATHVPLKAPPQKRSSAHVTLKALACRNMQPLHRACWAPSVPATKCSALCTCCTFADL